MDDSFMDVMTKFRTVCKNKTCNKCLLAIKNNGTNRGCKVLMTEDPKKFLELLTKAYDNIQERKTYAQVLAEVCNKITGDKGYFTEAEFLNQCPATEVCPGTDDKCDCEYTMLMQQPMPSDVDIHVDCEV